MGWKMLSPSLTAPPPRPTERLLVQPGLVHHLPAAQHHPGRQARQILSPHALRRRLQVRSCPMTVPSMGVPIRSPLCSAGGSPRPVLGSTTGLDPFFTTVCAGDPQRGGRRRGAWLALSPRGCTAGLLLPRGCLGSLGSRFPSTAQGGCQEPPEMGWLGWRAPTPPAAPVCLLCAP